jgi:hypothetical protein
LYIVREIVAAKGGTVEVASTAEEGTTFTVRIPRFLHVEGQSGRRESSRESTPAAADGGGMTAFPGVQTQ